MTRLEELKGRKIVVYLLQHIIDQTSPVISTLLVDLDANGIWIEGKELAETLHSTYKKPMPKTPVFFVPFAQIGWIVSFADYPYLSEKSLGLTSP
jgi:hypothetical protein